VRVRDDAVDFAFVAKSGQEVAVTVRDAPVAAVLKRLRARRSGGDRLFAYRAGGRWCALAAEQVNEYVRESLGGDFTAKDFRTWRANVVAAWSLSRADASTPTARKRAVADAMRTVAEHLGNTAAVARASYVDPRIVDLFH